MEIYCLKIYYTAYTHMYQYNYMFSSLNKAKEELLKIYPSFANHYDGRSEWTISRITLDTNEREIVCSGYIEGGEEEVMYEEHTITLYEDNLEETYETPTGDVILLPGFFNTKLAEIIITVDTINNSEYYDD